MPNLNRLVIDGANGFDLNANCFANVPNLKELSLNGIKVFHVTMKFKSMMYL